MGCGSGKTVIFSHIVKDAISKNRKVLVIVNKIILIENTLKTFKKLGLEATVYYGKKKEISNLMVGTIFSLKKIKDKEFDLLIWDECHRYDFESESIKNLMLKLNNTFEFTFMVFRFLMKFSRLNYLLNRQRAKIIQNQVF
jgi:superfamily II DNA or RNA helicase